MSLIAAQISSVETNTTSSTSSFKMLKVFPPISATAVPSAKRPTLFSFTGLPSVSAEFKQAASSVSTAIILVSGLKLLMYAATPAQSPPPPTGIKI